MEKRYLRIYKGKHSRSNGYNIESAFVEKEVRSSDAWPNNDEDYLWISEWIEVEFEQLDTRSKEIAALEKEKQKLRAEMTAKINEIASRIAELQALECDQ